MKSFFNLNIILIILSSLTLFGCTPEFNQKRKAAALATRLASATSGLASGTWTTTDELFMYTPTSMSSYGLGGCVDPTSGSVYILGTEIDAGGIYNGYLRRSTDDGLTFFPTVDYIPPLVPAGYLVGVRCAVDPSDGEVIALYVYDSTGLGNYSEIILRRSIDGGDNWSNVFPGVTTPFITAVNLGDMGFDSVTSDLYFGVADWGGALRIGKLAKAATALTAPYDGTTSDNNGGTGYTASHFSMRSGSPVIIASGGGNYYILSLPALAVVATIAQPGGLAILDRGTRHFEISPAFHVLAIVGYESIMGSPYSTVYTSIGGAFTMNDQFTIGGTATESAIDITREEQSGAYYSLSISDVGGASYAVVIRSTNDLITWTTSDTFYGTTPGFGQGIIAMFTIVPFIFTSPVTGAVYYVGADSQTGFPFSTTRRRQP